MSPMRHHGPEEEPAARGYAVTHPAGTVVLPQGPGWDQLILAAGGVMTVETPDGLWVLPPHRAAWVPAGVEHRLVMSGTVRLRTLYLAAGLAALPPACRVVDVSPLVRELVLYAVRVAPLWRDVPEHARLLGVLADQFVVLPDAPLQLPLPSSPVARAVADALLADPAHAGDVAALARAAGASRRTIERLFAREVGMPVGAWRQRLRLVTALRLLAAGHTTTEVALAVGYATPSAFAAMFRTAMHTTPRQWSAASPPAPPAPLP
jgi:AraC-like DNA-binding protein